MTRREMLNALFAPGWNGPKTDAHVWVWAWRRDLLAARRHPVQAVGRRLYGRLVRADRGNSGYVCLEVEIPQLTAWCWRLLDRNHPRVVAVGRRGTERKDP